MCLLRELYGAGVEKLRIEHQTITTPSKKKIEISTIASNYHLEVNPSDITHTISLYSSVVLLTEVDKLTKDAQHALRRTMEKYMSTCRLILCCNSTSKVIAPIRSRCLAVRVAAPSIEEVRGRLYELLTHCIPPEIIMKSLLSELLNNCDGQLKADVAQMAAYYEHRLQLGSKAIYHLEAFVAKFMAIYKRFMEDGLEAMMF
ncbi:hypothetical protein GDO78_021294 [Eleutherodactylus coqui]|nr:hypothetical protein GDO78_021294 [Eleutherodactylus coqui]